MLASCRVQALAHIIRDLSCDQASVESGLYVAKKRDWLKKHEDKHRGSDEGVDRPQKEEYSTDQDPVHSPIHSFLELDPGVV